MKRNQLLIAAGLGLIAALSACKEKQEEKPVEPQLTVNLKGLQNLGDDYVYENWIIEENNSGSPTSAGRFTVNDAGVLSQTAFDVKRSTLDAAVEYVLTIEPAKNDKAAPSDTKIVKGAFNNKSATPTIKGIFGTNFTTAEGSYFLDTPTTTAETDWFNGIWFFDKEETNVNLKANISLPDRSLKSGWEYEGWIIVGDQAISTGRFDDPDGKDFNTPGNSLLDPPPPSYSGTEGTAPLFPGEDFINAPSPVIDGVTFPIDLRGKKFVISIEP